jgi:hypothetical protein
VVSTLRWKVTLAAAVLLSLPLYWLFRPRPPELVAALRSLPEAARVDYSGPPDALLVIIHLRDWHYCPPELCEATGLNYREHLAAAERVQAEQWAIARFLVERLGINAAYKEGLTRESLGDWDLRVSLLRDLTKLDELGGLAEETRRHLAGLGAGGRRDGPAAARQTGRSGLAPGRRRSARNLQPGDG